MKKKEVQEDRWDRSRWEKVSISKKNKGRKEEAKLERRLSLGNDVKEGIRHDQKKKPIPSDGTNETSI